MTPFRLIVNYTVFYKFPVIFLDVGGAGKGRRVSSTKILQKTQDKNKINIITGNYAGEGCYLDGRKMMSLCATWWVNVMECA